MAANEMQVGGNHYMKHGKLQHWDVVRHFSLDYFQGQITKYVFRWRDKGGIQDLEKAKHYLDKYIEINQTPADTEETTLAVMSIWYDRMKSIQDSFVWEGSKEGLVMFTCKMCCEKVHAVNPIEAYIQHGDCKPKVSPDNN